MYPPDGWDAPVTQERGTTNFGTTGATYSIAVSVVDLETGAFSSLSQPIPETLGGTLPPKLSLKDPSNGPTITWEQPDGIASGWVSFYSKTRVNGQPKATLLVNNVNLNNHSYTFSNLPGGTATVFAVYDGQGSNGTISGFSDYSDNVTVKAGGPPAAPAEIAATVTYGSSGQPEANLAWQNTANNETAYLLTCAIGGGTPAVIASLAADATSYVAHLTAEMIGQALTFAVVAKNKAGTSAPTTAQAQAAQVQLHITDNPTTPGSNGDTDYANPWTVQVPNGYKVNGKVLTGGWIVQRVSIAFNVSAGPGASVNKSDVAPATYWEAWPVNSGGHLKGGVSFNSGTKIVDPNGPNDAVDDFTSIPDNEDHLQNHPQTYPSTGSIEWNTTAYFYPNLELPSSFTENGAGLWPHGLPATEKDPGLSPPSGEVPVIRDVKVTWNSIPPGSTPSEITDVKELENGKKVEYKNGKKTILPNQ
jgi:hypothetical protein